MKNSTFSAQVANNLSKVLQGYTKGIRLIALLTMLCTIGVGQMWAAEELYKTALFGSSYNSKKVSSYTDTWTATNNGFTVTVVNANNNSNGWEYIKMGRKSDLSVGSITTKEAIDKPISKITMTIDAVTAKNIKSIKLKTSTNGSSFAEAGTFTIAQGDQSVTINNPTANLYYQIEVDCSTGSNGSIQISKVQYYATEDAGSGGDEPVTPTPVDPTATFSNGEYTVGGAALDLSTLWESDSDGTVTYSVKTDGGTGASINGTSFTATAAGTCTVQASQAATATHNAATATATITVSAPAGGDGGDGECSWTLVTDASTLKVDDEIIIAASGDNNYALSTNQKSNNRGGTTITKKGNTLTAPSADVQILTLKAGSSSETFAFYTGASGYLYAASSSGNQLKTKSALDVHGSWTISITNGVASIAAKGSSNRNVMQYNYNNGSPLFACYASASQTSLAIYKKICSDDGGDDPEPVKTLTSIEITTPATQTTFWQGETFNHNGLVVTAHYSDAEDEIITPTVTGSTATAGTATVTVSYKEQSTSYAITVKAIPNTKETAYSVAEAYDIIDKLTTAEGVFISGTISQVDSYSDQYKSITYWISADGTTTKQLQVYSGKGLESADFAAVTDLSVGDQVIVCGNLKKYSGTYEFDKNNYLASHTPTTKDPAGLAYATTSYTANVGESFTTPELTNPHNLVVTYSTSDASKATVDANTGAVTIVAAGEVTITAATMGDASHEPGSASYTITIVDPAMAVATLPFTFNSGKADIENTAGMTQNGLGSDYSANTAPNSQLKFDGTGDWVVIRFDSEPEKLSYDIKNNSFSGGTFSVQESADGETYTDVEVHTEITNTQNEEHTLLSTSRYVKFIYTEKVDGNVGLGNIKITKPDLRQEAGIAWSTESVEITVGEDFTAPTLSNPNGLTLTCTSDNEDLVTVTNAGVITLKESVTGTAIITATFAGNKDYKQAEVSCTITVNAALVKPNWKPATITFEGIIQVACGSTTQLGAAAPNGPATITFNGYDLQNSVTVTASEGFLVSTNKEKEDTYKQEVTVNPHKDGQNIGKIQNVYVIAQAPAQSGNYNGTITLTGNDITNGSQVINVTAAVTCTQYTITWSVNGDTELIAPTTFYAGGDWTLPENPTNECNGREFVGWTASEILQPQDIVPNTLYKEKADFTIESDKTFYAVFAKESNSDTAIITDVLTRATTGISNGSGYGDWSDKNVTSSAVYAGRSAGGNDAIQLRTTDSNEGIITTTSGGKAKKVTVVWNNNTSNGRTLDIYGKNSTYSSAADLYNASNQGTKLGSIVNGTSTEFTINDDYEYIGLRSKSSAMYLTSISIAWETDDAGSGGSATYSSYTTSCADIKGIRIEEPTTTTFNEGDEFFFDGKVYAINNDDSETDVTNSPNLRFVYDMHKTGTQTVTVNYLGKSATYEITINAVEKWQITWNVSGATSTGLGPVQVAKETAIGTLPRPKSIPDGCNGYKDFVGWTESNEVNADGSDITFITSKTVPSKNTTYYAVFATQIGSYGDGDYVKVTETPADFSGEYLIVYEDAKGDPKAPVAFNGGLTTLDAASNTISVTITDNTIEATDATNAAKFTITKSADGYTIKSASGYFIGQTTNANGLKSSTTTYYSNNISINNDESAQVISGETYLRYNNVSAINQGNQTGLRFRYFKSDTYTNQQPIALYKKSGSSASYTDYTTGCHDVTITYYGFTGGYTTNCGGSDLNVITQRVNSSHTIPTCTEITDPTDLGRTFLNLWKDQNGKEHKPGDSFIVTQDITLYAQWKLETTGDIELPADKEDLATTDIVVTGGKTLTIPEGETITINSLTLKGGLLGEDSKSGYAMPSVVIPDNATLVRKNTTINLDLVVNNDSWYPFAVPFALDKNDNIDYLDPVLKAAATYNQHFAIKTYDGKNRAIVGTDQENNWDKVPQAAGLQPGKGYIISALTYHDKDTATIRIPMSVPNAWLANGEQESITVKEQTTTRNTVDVTAHTGAASDINKGGHQRHAGWNFVANPYLANFAGTNASGSFINGELLINKGDYSYSEDEVPYVTIPTYNFAHYYQVKLSEATLSPAYSFFVQVGTDGTMTFDVAGRQAAPASIAARNAEERPVKMDVDITLSDNHSSDQTGIIISDRYSEAYEIGRDLEKLFGSAYNLSVYTLMADNTPLAFQALAIRSNMQVIPVGYRTPAQGEYTFRLNEATSSIDLLNEQYEQLVLVDYQTGELTNLLIADYTFYSERTQADNRFAIYAVPRQNAPTDLPNAIGQDKQAQKIIHNGHLYILRDGNVYNGNGQIVK